MVVVFPFRKEIRTNLDGGEERWGIPLLNGKRGEKSPPAPSLLHILPISPLHSLHTAVQSFAQALTNPYSSASTHEAAAWTETRPGSHRSKGQKTSLPLKNNKKISHGAVIISSPDWRMGVSLLLPLPPGAALGDFSLTPALPLPRAHTAPALGAVEPSLPACAAGRLAEVGACPAQQCPGTSHPWRQRHPQLAPGCAARTSARWATATLNLPLPGSRFGRGQSCTWEVKQRDSNSLLILPLL